MNYDLMLDGYRLKDILGTITEDRKAFWAL